MTEVESRAVTPADRAYCYLVHKLALGPYVEAIWGWDESVQREMHDRAFQPSSGRIIVADGHDAGFMNVEDRPGELYLGRIELHPDFQGRGIGTTLIRRLIARAGDKAVRLEVLNVNRRAYALYTRLGFREIGCHGPNGIKIEMRYGGANDGGPRPGDTSSR